MGKYTILENGHCSFADPSFYNTFFLFIFIATINRFLQITMLSAYFVYLYKFNLNVRTAQVTLDVRHIHKLFRIATAMGSTIGFSFFTYFLVVFIPEYSEIIISITGHWTHPTGGDYDFLHVYKKDVYLVQSLLLRDQSELKTVLT